MAKYQNQLTERLIRALETPSVAQKKADGGGLYLYLTPAGRRIWRLKFRWREREQTLTIGHHPNVSLQAARKARGRAKESLRRGIDPRAKQRLQRMNTDAAIILDFDPNDGPSKREFDDLQTMVGPEHAAAVKGFFDASIWPLQQYRAYTRARAGSAAALSDSIANAKEQKRYYEKVRRQISALNTASEKLSETLESAPAEVLTAARESGTEIHEMKSRLISLSQSINDLTPQKSRESPELSAAIQSLATAFESNFGVAAVPRVPSENRKDRRHIPIEKAFVPLAAALLHRTEDTVCRAAKQALPSSLP